MNKKLQRISISKIDWNKKIKQRKFAFYEALRNKSIAQICENALKGDIQRIPKKLFKIPVTQNYEQERELRKQQCINQCEFEIKRLRLIADIKTKTVERIDIETVEYLKDCYDNKEAKPREDQWNEICNDEQKRSIDIWNNKRKFFESDKHLISINSENKFVAKRNANCNHCRKQQMNINRKQQMNINRKQQMNINRKHDDPNNNYGGFYRNNWRIKERNNFKHFNNQEYIWWNREDNDRHIVRYSVRTSNSVERLYSCYDQHNSYAHRGYKHY